MLKRDKQHTKLNNKGMTLIEVIVSVTLLALVSGFILSSLVSAMGSAAKSRDLHRATTVAQNIMEGIKLKTAEEIAYQFNYPHILNAAGNPIDNFSVYPSTSFQYSTDNSVGELFDSTDGEGNPILEKAGIYRTLAEYNALLADPTANAYMIASTASAYMPDMTVDSYEFLRDTDKKYTYYMRNIENDGRYFNAKITLSAANYTASGSSGITANDDMLISVPTIDSTYDAVEVMGNNYDDKAMNQLQLLEGEAVAKSDLHRTIEIEIDDAIMPGGSHRTRVDVRYLYSFDKDDGTISATFRAQENTPFYNEGNEETKPLRSIYLYYYPLYRDGSNTDTIVVKNPDNIDVEVYIIKQVDGTLSDDQLRNKEDNYKVTFNVIESTDSADGNSHITLHTNLDENLYAIDSPIVLTPPTQSILRRNNTNVSETMFRKTDLRNKKAIDRMYDVRVEIYSSEKAADETAFINTHPKDFFKAEDHLFTFESSICQ